MNYLELKTTLHEMIDQVVDPEVLYTVQELLNSKQSDDFLDELPNEVKLSIEKGLQQADNCEVVSHEEVMKKYEKWLSK